MANDSSVVTIKGRLYRYQATRRGVDITGPDGRTVHAFRSPSGDGTLIAPQGGRHGARAHRRAR